MTDTKSIPERIQQVVLKVEDRFYGVAVSSVREMMELPELTDLPGTPAEIRGVMNLRGRIIPVLNLRLELGVESLQHEVEALCSMLDQRKTDHVNWLAALEASVEEGRPFEGQTNPHLCAFGKWFDSFEHKNRQIKSFVLRFDVPHKRIHSLAVETQALIKDGRVDDAKDLICATRGNELAAMISLFDQLQDMLEENKREVVVLLDTKDVCFAISVDDVEAVEWLDEAPTTALMERLSGDRSLTRGVAMRQSGSGDELVAILEVESLANSLRSICSDDLSCV